MALLPTTRITATEPGIPGLQDEDILLVDFQPVVVPNTQQILSSPSATTTAMYPIPPPIQLPSAHMTGLNHLPSLSSDGVTSPLSATSSGKVTTTTSNPNNNLVNLSNHVLSNHNNNANTSRDESDFNYPPIPTSNHLQQRLPPPHLPNKLNAINAVSKHYDDDDEVDEFDRHQAMAHQPTYMNNTKRRIRRVTNNANHVGFYHNQQSPQAQISTSSLSSSDSDTEFLMGRKTAFTRKSVQRMVDPPNHTGGNVSPSATSGLLPNLGNKKRVRRKRPSARNRKPTANQHDNLFSPSDVLSYCCCLCQDRSHRTTSARSIRNRYLRLICFIVVIIIVAVLTSITLSLQRKVDSIDLSLKKMDQAIGSPLSSDTSAESIRKPVETLISAQSELNSTVVSLKTQLDQLQNKLQDFQSKLNIAVSKPDGEADVKATLGKLGSRVEELSSTIEKVQESIEHLKEKEKEKTAADNNNNSSGGGGGGSMEPHSTK